MFMTFKLGLDPRMFSAYGMVIGKIIKRNSNGIKHKITWNDYIK